jgi:hypothetical protein
MFCIRRISHRKTSCRQRWCGVDISVNCRIGGCRFKNELKRQIQRHTGENDQQKDCILECVCLSYSCVYMVVYKLGYERPFYSRSGPQRLPANRVTDGVHDYQMISEFRDALIAKKKAEAGATRPRLLSYDPETVDVDHPLARSRAFRIVGSDFPKCSTAAFIVEPGLSKNWATDTAFSCGHVRRFGWLTALPNASSP